MKNENVAKINKLGKISRIIINIVRVFVIIDIVCIPIVCILVMMLPNDSLKVTGSGSAQIIIEDDEFLEDFLDIDIEESDLDAKFFGMDVKWLVNDEKDAENNRVLSIEGGLNEFTAKQMKYIVLGGAFAGEIIFICILVALCFAKKLALALEKCDSPFEEEVLRRMKGFGIALAVWAGAVLLINGVSGIFAAFVVIVVLLFISIFKYGAQLQQESDETL